MQRSFYVTSLICPPLTSTSIASLAIFSSLPPKSFLSLKTLPAVAPMAPCWMMHSPSGWLADDYCVSEKHYDWHGGSVDVRKKKNTVTYTSAKSLESLSSQAFQQTSQRMRTVEALPRSGPTAGTCSDKQSTILIILLAQIIYKKLSFTPFSTLCWGGGGPVSSCRRERVWGR